MPDGFVRQRLFKSLDAWLTANSDNLLSHRDRSFRGRRVDYDSRQLELEALLLRARPRVVAGKGSGTITSPHRLACTRDASRACCAPRGRPREHSRVGFLAELCHDDTGCPRSRHDHVLVGHLQFRVRESTCLSKDPRPACDERQLLSPWAGKETPSPVRSRVRVSWRRNQPLLWPSLGNIASRATASSIPTPSTGRRMPREPPPPASIPSLLGAPTPVVLRTQRLGRPRCHVDRVTLTAFAGRQAPWTFEAISPRVSSPR